MPRAWVIHEYSGYEGLSLIEEDEETPGPGEIRLRVEAFACNWGDMDLMLDHYSFSFPTFPARIGIEAAGIVDAIGPGVEGIQEGERYCTLPYFYDNRGTSAESVIIDARYVAKAPEGLSAVESASIWMMYLTAYYPIVELTGAGPGTAILATGATGTAGLAALEIGRLQGATMIATTRFDHNRELLEQSGASHVFVEGSGDLADAIREVTSGRGIDAAYDCVGAHLIGQYSPALARNATIYCYGLLDGSFPELPIVDMFQANATFHPYSVFNYVMDAELVEQGKAFVHETFAAGELRPCIDRVFPMEGYRESWDYMSQPRTSHGKVVIETGL